VLEAINYCHKQGVCHRDLKPENFIFESKDSGSDLKVIDFGLSKICEGASSKAYFLTQYSSLAKGILQRMKTKAGTPYYISPEVLTGSYDISCDMWSAGCILYILLCGYPPFYGEDDQEILRAVIRGEFEFEGDEWLEVSVEAKDLISKLICKPESRLNAEEALQHKWIRQHKQEGLQGSVKKMNKINIDALKKF
jgi:calcium-dependent protein kinase